MDYRQCKLQRGRAVTVSWIPQKFAKKGKYVKLCGVDHWQVIEVWGKLSGKEVLDRERDYKRQRKASDI